MCNNHVKLCVHVCVQACVFIYIECEIKHRYGAGYCHLYPSCEPSEQIAGLYSRTYSLYGSFLKWVLVCMSGSLARSVFFSPSRSFSCSCSLSLSFFFAVTHSYACARTCALSLLLSL